MKTRSILKLIFQLFLGLYLIWQSACAKITYPSQEKSLQEIPLDGGVWKSSCFSIISNNVISGYIRIEYQFDGVNKSYISFLKGFSDGNCTMSTYNLEAIGTYTLSNMRGTSNSNSYSNIEPLYTMYDIDSTNQSVKAVALTSSQVTAWNTNSYCGINSWTINTQIEISGSTCNDSAVPAIGTVDYDIIKYYFTSKANLGIESSTIPEKSLTFGKSETGADGKTPATRKTTEETYFLFSKK